MSILIKRLFGEDMPMPQEGFVDIRIHFKSGKLRYVTMPTGENPFYATFEVEKLPPHGRLIDADILKEVLERNFGHTGGASVLAQLIDARPTVIEAEGSEK